MLLKWLLAYKAISDQLTQQIKIYNKNIIFNKDNNQQQSYNNYKKEKLNGKNKNSMEKNILKTNSKTPLKCGFK